MFTIICVFNDKDILRANLLKRLNKNADVVLIDNTLGKYSNLPKLLNKEAEKASGNYLMFIHQDIYLEEKNWLEKAEDICSKIRDLGVAGVAGVSPTGEPKGFIIDRGRFWGQPFKNPISVMTLDELLLIIPKKVFTILKFDERYRYHSYGADYCLQVRELNLKPYVIPLLVSHNSSTIPILKAGSLYEDDVRLLLKWRLKGVRDIYKTTGKVDEKLLKHIRRYPPLPPYLRCIFYRLKDIFYRKIRSNIILDIGVLPIEQMRMLNIKSTNTYTIGICDKLPYILASKRLKVHDDYILASPLKMPIKEKTGNAIITGLEYIHKERALKIIEELQKVSRKLAIYIPNRGRPLGKAYTFYISNYNEKELKTLGFKSYGIGSVLILKYSIPFPVIFPRLSNRLLCLSISDKRDKNYKDKYKFF